MPLTALRVVVERDDPAIRSLCQPYLESGSEKTGGRCLLCTVLLACPSWGDSSVAGSIGIRYQLTRYSKKKGIRF